MILGPKILVVDDEPDARELIRINLEAHGFQVTVATDGAEALSSIRSAPPDLVVLDVMLPQIDGMDVCKTLRRDPETLTLPIVMVTAKRSELDRVLGLELGADDYIPKPFSPRELILRIRGLLRRRQQATPAAETIQSGVLFVDIPKRQVLVGSRPVELTATEFKLLLTLMERRGRVQTREQLLRDVWVYDKIDCTRTVDTHIRRLREKLGEAGEYIDTLRGFGYRFLDPENPVPGNGQEEGKI